ncbi:hypothetical protein FFLO_06586 [Filobasidium floriforme]|uniref:Thioester reductase (TE) domain-containing protein n=1 Tax=Filobasidium floriforme TaxID=5210 RepID=A0A8K0NKF3_9TREE|nr:uncharacterized protein HD553DRAFT_352458 [Filobasidium floriforme]KAG7527796.1 hypothetical protein FFLO_06586 [Filobasidium floriforme]KAH8080021.1 hypothetical protein HD553DRAFT_352458 [Filobasidium floriforme]
MNREQQSILVTGGTGYLGGDILAEIREDSRYDDVAIYATVRNKSLWPNFEAIRIIPVELDLGSPQDLDAFIRERHVKLVIETTDSATDNIAIPCIKALQANNGTYIALLLYQFQSNGTKQWSMFAGFDPEKALYDDDPDFLPTVRRSVVKADSYPVWLKTAASATENMLSLGEELGVGVHVVAPCLVHGPSRSLGNPLSIQVPALVKIASKMGKLFTFSDDRDGGKQEWTQCHIRDTTALYKLIIDKTFSNETIESGVYFAENGFFEWKRLYGLVTDVLGLPNALAEPSQEDVNQMAEILSVRPDEVAAQISGRQVLPCDLDRSDRGTANYRDL